MKTVPAQELRHRLAIANLLEWAKAFTRRKGVTLDTVLGRNIEPSVARVRRHMWCVLRDTMLLSYPELGRLFGRDHTSILTGIKRHRLERDTGRHYTQREVKSA